MTNDRARARARRRWAKRQASTAARAQRRRRNQQVIGAVVTVLVVVGGVLALSQLVDDPTSAGAAPTASPTASNPCPAPTSAPKETAPSFAKAPAASLAQGKVWDATVVTSCGDITMELYGDKAPQTVASFVSLARARYFDGSPCHRVTSSASLKVLQCGDPTGTGSGGPGYGFGLENVPADGAYPTGTLAMARSSSPDSNGSQFFVSYGDSSLPVEQTGGGYTVFGKVTKGLDVVTTVAAGGTTTGQSDGAPARAISIESITVTPR